MHGIGIRCDRNAECRSAGIARTVPVAEGEPFTEVTCLADVTEAAETGGAFHVPLKDSAGPPFEPSVQFLLRISTQGAFSMLMTD